MKKSYIVIHLLVVLMMLSAFSAWAAKEDQKTGYMDDTMITAKIKSKIAEDNSLKSTEIGVETQNGVVQLSGFVDSQKSIDRAGQIASSVQGVKSVKNDLHVQRESDQMNKDQGTESRDQQMPRSSDQDMQNNQSTPSSSR